MASYTDKQRKTLRGVCKALGGHKFEALLVNVYARITDSKPAICLAKLNKCTLCDVVHIHTLENKIYELTDDECVPIGWASFNTLLNVVDLSGTIRDEIKRN